MAVLSWRELMWGSLLDNRPRMRCRRSSAGRAPRRHLALEPLEERRLLAAGDLGIAMGAAGSDVAINSASIALMNDDLRRIPFLVEVSRKTRRVINQNLGFGVGFIILGISLSKFVPPGVAAFLHFASSLVVVFNSARLVRQGEELDHEPHAA